MLSRSSRCVEALSGVRVVAIAAGCFHLMVLTDEGEVLSSGIGKLGQLGHGDREDQWKFKVIEALRGRHVVAIAAGGLHSMVLTDDGTVLSFGDGAFPSGVGAPGADRWLVPQVIEALNDERVHEGHAKRIYGNASHCDEAKPNVRRRIAVDGGVL